MARILLTVPPLTGHLNPALAVAEALAQAGHLVAWAVHARALREQLPVRARVYPLDAETPDEPGITHGPVRGLESVRLFFEDYTVPIARQMMAPLEAICRSFRPDVLVVDHQLPGGALVARKLGLPWATLVTTSASILKMSPMLDAWVEQQYAGLQGDTLPAALHVPRPDFSPHLVLVFATESLVGTAHARVPAPYVFVGRARGEGRRAVDFPFDWLRPDARKLLVTLGTVSRDRDTRFFEVLMAAIADLPAVQAVMVAPSALAAQAPPNVLIREYIPQLDVLRAVDGVVCHAGHNTVCEALTLGLPLIVAPIRDDQPVVARQVIDAGAGLFMRHGKVTPATARALLLQLLETPALRENAARLGADLRAAPGAAGAALHIADLAAPAAAPRLRQVA